MRIDLKWAAAFFSLCWGTGPLRADDTIDYLRDIKPILSQHCYSCHGALKQKSGLRLDTAALLKRGGDNGSAIESGKSAESLLIEAVTGANGVKRMPLDGEPLTPEQIAKLRAWIDQGAAAPEEKTPEDPRRHWAYQPPQRPPLPSVRNNSWVRNPVDAFVAAEHERLGLAPRPAAEKHVLLRRVYLDLIGLPPTREELLAVLDDPDPQAYENAVDRLLASPHYGERWGRHWMDVWRYSDWAGWGQQVRDSQPHIWRWRDWIVESLNEGKGYDQMVLEMLAGDEVAPTDERVLRATGYLVRNFKLLSRETWMQDTVNHTSKAFLATTMECARCHDHMYDPVTQREYYELRAIFEPHHVRIDRLPGQADTAKDGLPRVFDAEPAVQTFLFVRGDDRLPEKEKPLPPGVPGIFGGSFDLAAVPVPSSVSYPALKPFIQAETLATAQAAVEQATAAAAKAGETLEAARKNLPKPDAETTSANTALENAVKQAELAAEIAARQLAFTQANKASLEARIAADIAKFATPPDPNSAALALAAANAERQAAFHKAQETAALAAQQLFAAQQALKPDDEKTKAAVAETEKKLEAARKALEAAESALASDAPAYSPLSASYPAASTGRRLALARWIIRRDNPVTARVAINHLWLRHFSQALVPSVFDFGINGKRPTHPQLLDWLAVELMENGWKMKPLHRLIVTSNTYRMASTGDPACQALDPENQYLWRSPSRRMEAEVVRDSVLFVAGQLNPALGGPDLEPADWLANKRRSIYFRHAQEKQMLFMKLFDGATVNECYTRKESIVPQQALALANSELTLLLGRSLARKLSAESSVQSADFIKIAFEQVLSRPPRAEEAAACAEFLTQQERFYQEKRALLTGTAGAPVDTAKPSADPILRARENLVHVLINHNDFVTIR